MKKLPYRPRFSYQVCHETMRLVTLRKRYPLNLISKLSPTRPLDNAAGNA